MVRPGAGVPGAGRRGLGHRSRTSQRLRRAGHRLPTICLWDTRRVIADYGPVAELPLHDGTRHLGEDVRRSPSAGRALRDRPIDLLFVGARTPQTRGVLRPRRALPGRSSRLHPPLRPAPTQRGRPDDVHGHGDVDRPLAASEDLDQRPSRHATSTSNGSGSCSRACGRGPWSSASAAARHRRSGPGSTTSRPTSKRSFKSSGITSTTREAVAKPRGSPTRATGRSCRSARSAGSWRCC